MGQRLVVLAVFLLARVAIAAPASTPATTRAAVEISIAKVDPAPTLVSVKLSKVSASEMFTKLAQEAKISLTPQNDSLWDEPALQEASFSTEWDKQPLWDAVKEACEGAGVRVMPDDSNESSGRVQVLHGAMPGYLWIDGPVMIWPRHVVRSAAISYADGTHKPDQVRMTMMVLPEPKLRRFVWYSRPKIDEASDDQGHSLIAAAVGEMGRGSAAGSAVPVILEYPQKVGNKIAIVSGSISMEVPKELATIAYRPPFEKLENVQTDIGPNRLVLKSMKPDGSGGFHVVLSLLRGKDETDEHWTAMAEPFGRFAAPVTLIGLRGETRQNGGSGGSSRDEAHAELYFSPREAGDEATELRIVLPTKFAPLTAKFEFKDLPMP